MQNDVQIREKNVQSCRDKAGTRGFFSKAGNPCYRTFIASYYVFFILEIVALKMNMANAVPDPEPSLLNSNFVKPNKLQLLFQPSGKYAASTHFIHIRVPINFSHLMDTPMKIFNHYHKYIEKCPEPFCTQVEEVAEISRSCITNKVNDLKYILDVLPQYKVVICDKQFLDLVAIGMSTAELIHIQLSLDIYTRITNCIKQQTCQPPRWHYKSPWKAF